MFLTLKGKENIVITASLQLVLGMLFSYQIFFLYFIFFYIFPLHRNGLKRCAICSSFYYCNKTCQSIDWKSHHKYDECKYYSIAFANDILQYMTTMDRFLLRLYLKLTIVDPGLYERELSIFNGSSRSFHSLMDHREDIENDENRVDAIQHILTIFNSLGLPNIDSDKIISLYGKITTNGFELGSECNNIASGFYVESAVFDHSCSPNAAIVFDSKKSHRCQVRAIKNIFENEEIFISYINLRMIREDRLKILKSNYYFDCHCEKCESNNSDVYDSMIMEINESMEKYDSLQDGDPNEVKILMSVDSLLEKVYQGYHPDYTMHIMRLVKAIKYSNIAFKGMKRNGNYSKIWNKMIQHVTITHGVDHTFYVDFFEQVCN